MVTETREYIDFWIETSVHAREQYGGPGAEQDVAELVRRLVQAGEDQGITAKAMTAEVGDLAAYIRGKLGQANEAEKDRRK